MVNLALLCNLYADGPTTLGRLRELGCENLEAVEQLTRADLEWALQAGSSTCDRFRREARLLLERGGGAREPAARAAAPSTTAAPVVERVLEREPASERGPEVEREPEREPEPASAERSPRDSSILGVLLQAWRRASGRGAVSEGANSDADTFGEQGASGARIPSTAASAPTSNEPDTFTSPPGERHIEVPARPRPSMQASVAPDLGTVGGYYVVRETASKSSSHVHEQRNVHGTSLDRIGFQGVEADYAEQLAHLGIRTVEDFLSAQPLELAGRSAMRYTVLLRMQFLARRELERVSHG